MSATAMSTETSCPITPRAVDSSKQFNAVAEKPKPCCVCKPEKAARDDCMLFSKSDNPAELECRPIIEQYRNCMAGFGFKV